MHQIRFQPRLRPRPHWGAYSTPPDLPSGFKGPTSKGKEKRKDGMKWGRIGEGRGGDLRTSKAREGKGRVSPPSNPEPNLADDCSTRQTRSARPTLSYCVPCTSPRTLVCLFLNSCSSLLRLVGQQLSVLSSSVSHRLELHYLDLWYNKLRNLWQAQLVVEQIHNTYIG